ncbi:MAG: tRNA (adenosine(37)-N6)-threonylcarbamoyltransferase complex dimerization subunit type 1 TsaB [Candidatus Babeliales bacterium]
MTYLAIQNTYDQVQIGLCKNQTIIARTTIDKIHANAQCIPALDVLLSEHNLIVSDLTYIITNCGPGPFTTLRVVLATINGIHYASQIPLVGIDSLDAIIEEYRNPAYINVALLNAFNQDVYYAIADTNGIRKGCQNISHFIAELAHIYPQQPIQFVGNGALLHQEHILNAFGSYAIMPTPMPETCSLDQIHRMGVKKWHEGKGQRTPLTPHYLKSAHPKL